ncbi:MAG: type I-E CRISPR-associated protein Cas6/Cse3/CasE [candidate division WOR-3 bacterium]
MYFSRISLREDARASFKFWSVFRDPYQIHKSLWNLFGDHPDRERDFLYHVAEVKSQPLVYAVSARLPVGEHPIWRVETKPYEPQIAAGMRLGFLLRVNPVRTRNGKRHDVVMEAKHRLKAQGIAKSDFPLEAAIVQDAVEEWLRAREDKAGFHTVVARADGYRQHQFFKAREQLLVRFSTVDLTGVIEVIDTEAFRKTLFRGFGPAKSFGCGLMLIRRA